MASRPRKVRSGATRSSARAPGPSPSSTSRTPPAATVAALERGAPGVYNVVDDEPAPLREWLPAYAEALGAKPPRRVPAWLARLVAGRPSAGSALELRGAANAKAKRELGWEPALPELAAGLRRGAGSRGLRMPAVTDLDAAKETLLAELREHSLVLGEVTLASGAMAQYYVDARRTLMRPAGFRAAGELIAAAAARARGRARSAVRRRRRSRPPARRSRCPPAADLVAFFVRGERKEHGLQRWVEGPVEPGMRCLVVEDTVTTGGSTATAIGRIREEGLEVAGVRRRRRPPRRRRRADRSGGRGPLPRPGHDRRDLPGAARPRLRRRWSRTPSRSASSAA